jgi:hypothetical protein
MGLLYKDLFRHKREQSIRNLDLIKPEGRRQLGRPRHRWLDNIKMDPRDIGWNGMD